MRVFAGLDDVVAAAGEDLGFSEWHTVTQESVQLFADATDDHQWIHLDVERAKAGPFGGTIQHGFMTLSLLPMLMREVYSVDGISMGINYGMNKVRFPAAVPVGSRVRGHIVLVAAERTDRGVMATVSVTIELEGSAKPACVAEALALLVPA
ncbi:MaoC family dehydratase [Microbacterium sp. ASV49]|uniref:MaoC family dehydratase n=1 Tax=Microbacterium candidum TaxID=3041922 RepID=A0ABT7MVH5_9MICO|nr:MaoC family dehydratase [Microbacterium sp. ASV49]MDL9978460.1 MaoC family dehydratase [Microbacterium sp. ASV49]